MGYGSQQIADLEATINRTECDTVVIATPIDLKRIINIQKPTVKVSYDLQEIGFPNFDQIIREFLRKKGIFKDSWQVV